MRSLIPWRSRGGNLESREGHPLQQFRRDFDALFDRMWGGALTPSEEDWGAQRLWDLDVRENDKEFVVRAEMPGFEEKELDLQVADNVLTIKAEKEQQGDGQQQYRRFYRSFTLPGGTDPDKIQASYRSGVLEVHIPRSEQAKPKRITVQGGNAEQAGAHAKKGAAPAAKA